MNETFFKDYNRDKELELMLFWWFDAKITPSNPKANFSATQIASRIAFKLVTSLYQYYDI